jgi:hypothetical protein
VVEGDDYITVAEAADGVDISGSAQAGSDITVTWSNLQPRSVNVPSSGLWSINYLASDLPAPGTTDVSVVASVSNLSSSPTVRSVSIQNPPPTGLVSVLPLGDSTTKGDEQDEDLGMTCPGGVSHRSYRGALQTLMSNAGYTFDFSGPVSNIPASGGSDGDHAGYGGAMINSFTASDPVSTACLNQSTTPTPDGNSQGNIVDRLDGILTAGVDPDIIVVAAGWNSLNCDTATDTSANQMSTLVSELVSRRPNAKLLLTTITPRQGETEAQTATAMPAHAALNQRIRALAAGSSNIFLADIATLPLNSNDYRDSIHWCQSAADQIAQVLFDRIDNDIDLP